MKLNRQIALFVLRKTYDKMVIMTKYLITKSSYQKLLQRKIKIEGQLKDAGKRAGEACGTSCDWHDNFAYEQSTKDITLFYQMLKEIKEKTKQAVVVESNSCQNTVEVGNKIVIQINGTCGAKKYLLDEIIGNNQKEDECIPMSPNSIFGKAVLGQKVGGTGKFEDIFGRMCFFKVVRIEK